MTDCDNQDIVIFQQVVQDIPAPAKRQQPFPAWRPLTKDGAPQLRLVSQQFCAVVDRPKRSLGKRLVARSQKMIDALQIKPGFLSPNYV
ncbi:hypothetical protein RugamoR64_44160 [Duganella rhizosphaerae]